MTDVFLATYVRVAIVDAFVIILFVNAGSRRGRFARGGVVVAVQFKIGPTDR